MNRHIQGISRPKAVKYLRNDIWEFRAKDQGICLRVLYFTESPHCVGAHTFVKKERVTSTADIDQARRAKSSWASDTCGGPDW
ncbi:MAG: type II toxin-antitoxin system RelE/ParE family toxin [Actinomycetota bacterium]